MFYSEFRPAPCFIKGFFHISRILAENEFTFIFKNIWRGIIKFRDLSFIPKITFFIFILVGNIVFIAGSGKFGFLRKTY